jgi:hypothetical protein
VNLERWEIERIDKVANVYDYQIYLYSVISTAVQRLSCYGKLSVWNAQLLLCLELPCNRIAL